MPTSSNCAFLVRFRFLAADFGNLESMASQIELDPTLVLCVSHTQAGEFLSGWSFSWLCGSCHRDVMACWRAAAIIQAVGASVGGDALLEAPATAVTPTPQSL